MRWLVAALVASTLLPAAARADMGVPGFSRVPHDFVFEVAADFPGYQFWLLSPRGVEPLDLVLGRPFLVNGDDRNGSHRIATVVVAPAGLAEKMGMAKFEEALRAPWSGKGATLPAGVLQSDHIDFIGSIPFHDSRDRVVDRYRVELVPGQQVRLVWLEQNEGSRWVKRTWIAVGIFVPVATIWGGWWVIRRVRRVWANKPA